MKKVLSIVLVLVMVLAFAGCGKEEKAEQVNSDRYFDAEVLEIYEKYILVKPIDGENISYDNGNASVSTVIQGTNELPKLEVGMEIRIMFGGQVMETDPVQIDTVFAIYPLDEIKAD